MYIDGSLLCRLLIIEFCSVVNNSGLLRLHKVYGEWCKQIKISDLTRSLHLYDYMYTYFLLHKYFHINDLLVTHSLSLIFL